MLQSTKHFLIPLIWLLHLIKKAIERFEKCGIIFLYEIPILFIITLKRRGICKIFNKLFKLKENNTNVRTEVIAGITAFVTMAYILAVNPSILSETGMDATAVLLATCIASFIGTIFTALLYIKGYKGAILFGIFGTWAAGMLCQLVGLYITDPENG